MRIVPDTTITCWIRVLSLPNFQNILSRVSTAFGKEFVIAVHESGQFNLRVSTDAVDWNPVDGVFFGGAIALNRWYFLTIVRQGFLISGSRDLGEAAVIDLVDQNIVQLHPSVQFSTGLTGDGTWPGHFDLDDLKYWGRVLSLSELDELYQQGPDQDFFASSERRVRGYARGHGRGIL